MNKVGFELSIYTYFVYTHTLIISLTLFLLLLPLLIASTFRTTMLLLFQTNLWTCMLEHFLCSKSETCVCVQRLIGTKSTGSLGTTDIFLSYCKWYVQVVEKDYQLALASPPLCQRWLTVTLQTGYDSLGDPPRPTIREQLSEIVGDRDGEFILPLGKKLKASLNTLTISQKRNIKRQAYLNEVEQRNDSVFFATIGAFVLLPPAVILSVAILTGYVQLFPWIQKGCFCFHVMLTILLDINITNLKHKHFRKWLFLQILHILPLLQSSLPRISQLLHPTGSYSFFLPLMPRVKLAHSCYGTGLHILPLLQAMLSRLLHPTITIIIDTNRKRKHRLPTWDLNISPCLDIQLRKKKVYKNWNLFCLDIINQRREGFWWWCC